LARKPELEGWFQMVSGKKPLSLARLGMLSPRETMRVLIGWPLLERAPAAPNEGPGLGG
jgi:hypothetical protein